MCICVCVSKLTKSKCFIKNPNVNGKPAKFKRPTVIQKYSNGKYFNNPPIRRVSWYPRVIRKTLPTHINTPALKKPCTYKYKIVNSFISVEHNTIKNPQWLIVEYANVFFISDCANAHTPPYAAVKDPTNGIINLVYCVTSKMKLNLRIKYTPADTKVAE